MPRQPKDPNQDKRKKSTYGAGTVYQRKDGRYVASIKDPVSGERIERYAKTKKEAEKKLEDIKFEIRQGTLATGPDQTMAQYLAYWLENIHHPQIRIGTYERYRGVIRNYIIPAIGNIQMRKLSPYHVQNLYNSPAVAKLSPGSITRIHAVLHTALDKAVEWNLIARNVCDVVSPPSQKQREYTVLDMAQAKRLLDGAKGHRLEALLTLTLASGMRRGEIFGLKWEDVDLNNGAIQIKRTMSRVGKHGIITSEPKTSRGRRKILLPQFAVDALKLHYEYQLEAKEKAGSKWEENGFVFPNTLGKYLGESALHSIFKKLLAETGLPYMRFHDLRHSAATILLSMGVHPKVVQELLGHSQISTTLDTYSHVLPTVQKEAMDKFNNLFNQ